VPEIASLAETTIFFLNYLFPIIPYKYLNIGSLFKNPLKLVSPDRGFQVPHPVQISFVYIFVQRSIIYSTLVCSSPFPKKPNPMAFNAPTDTPEITS